MFRVRKRNALTATTRSRTRCVERGCEPCDRVVVDVAAAAAGARRGLGINAEMPCSGQRVAGHRRGIDEYVLQYVYTGAASDVDRVIGNFGRGVRSLDARGRSRGRDSVAGGDGSVANQQQAIIPIGDALNRVVGDLDVARVGVVVSGGLDVGGDEAPWGRAGLIAHRVHVVAVEQDVHSA